MATNCQEPYHWIIVRGLSLDNCQVRKERKYSKSFFQTKNVIALNYTYTELYLVCNISNPFNSPGIAILCPAGISFLDLPVKYWSTTEVVLKAEGLFSRKL